MVFITKSFTLLLLIGVFSTYWAAPSTSTPGFEILNAPKGSRDSYFFIISTQRVPWYTARQICESIGAYRYVSLESADKTMEVYLKLASSGFKDAWTSGNDVLSNGDYRWAARNNMPFGDFQDWRTKFENGTSKPPNNPDCHCVSVTALAGECGTECIGKWGWDEENCSEQKFVVCEPDSC